MTLTTVAVKNAEARPKAYKISDEKGVFLLVQPTGGKLWRFKYRVDGSDTNGSSKRVEKKLAIGAFPKVSLKQARE